MIVVSANGLCIILCFRNRNTGATQACYFKRFIMDIRIIGRSNNRFYLYVRAICYIESKISCNFEINDICILVPEKIVLFVLMNTICISAKSESNFCFNILYTCAIVMGRKMFH